MNESALSLRRWIFTCFWGWMVGVVLIMMLSSLLDSLGIEHMQFYLGIGIGAGVGFSQWLFLRKRFAMHQHWLWFSVLGLGLPFIPIDLLPEGTTTHKIALSILLGAALLSLLQYRVLQAYSPKAHLWIAPCFAGWTLGVMTVFAVDYTKYLGLPNIALAFVNLLLILAGGVVLGAISGLSLRKILAAKESLRTEE